MQSTSLTTATTFLDSLRPTFELTIDYQIPSSSNSTQPEQPDRFASSSASSNTLQSNHASQSITFFPPSPTTGFINARVINHGFTLELRWSSSTKSSLHQHNPNEHPSSNPLGSLDFNGSHQPVHFHFPEKIIPTPFMTLSNDFFESDPGHHQEHLHDEAEPDHEQVLIILVLTENYTLYRLKFRYPRLFYSELFEEDWITEYEVEEILNRQVILTHGIDSNNLIIACSDGVLTHLSWGKLVGIDDSFGWKTSNLSLNRSAIGGLWSFLPTTWSTSESKTISSSAHEWVATPSSTISIASHLTAGASGEDAWLFTISRERKLKAWSLTTGLCLKELALSPSFAIDHQSFNVDSSHRTNRSDHRPQNSLLPAAPRTLARFIYSDEGDDPGYEGFLVVFVPSPICPCFITYGLAMTGENQFKDLVLLEERRCDWTNHRPKLGELRDFQISKLNLEINSLNSSPYQKQTPWGLWVVWDDDLGGEGVLQYTILHETRNWHANSNQQHHHQWITIQPPDRKTPWNSSYFDELINNDPSSSLSEIFLDHLLRPGHFSYSDLEYALTSYEANLESGADHETNNLNDLLDNSLYDSLEEKICAVVGSDVKLEISNQTGTPMVDSYHRKIRIEWLKFATMCFESRASALWPIELSVDGDRQQLFINGRRSITTPVFIDTASLLCQLVHDLKDGDEKKKPRLLEQDVDQIEIFHHPLISNLNNRLDLVYLLGTMDCLIENLSYPQVIKPLEDDLIQTVRRPLKSAMVELMEDLFNRRLDAIIDESLEEKIQEKLTRVKDLELALQIFWNILSTSELARSSSSDLDYQEAPEGDGNNATILSTMFVTDYVINSIEKRYELVRNSLIFLIYLQGMNNPLPEDPDSILDLSTSMSQYLVSFQQSLISRWICRQNSKISAELAFEVEDKLVDKLVELHVSTSRNNRRVVGGGGDVAVGHPDGVLITNAKSATSLLSSLLLTRLRPELNLNLKLPGSISASGNKFLEQAGLFKNLSSLISSNTNTTTTTNPNQEEINSLKMKLIEIDFKLIQLINFLLNVGLTNLVLQFTLSFRDPSCAVEFLLGQAYLKSDLIEDAESCFIKAASAIYDENFEIDDQSGFRLILPECARTNLLGYYSYIVSLFETMGSDQSVAKFCQLAIDASIDDTALTQSQDFVNQPDDAESVLALWVKMFKAFVRLAMWDDAYEALICIPSTESQHDCLRTLVSNMCEANEIDKLLRFSWLGLQIEFEKAISFRARNSDALSVPNYFSVLYAYHINRADYRSAAVAMYQHGRKIGEISVKGAAFQFLMTQQCQSYLAAINSLSLVPEKHAWITLRCGRSRANNRAGGSYGVEKTIELKSSAGIRRRKRVDYYIPEAEFAPGTRDIEVITLADIREEYTLVLSRLQLANAIPSFNPNTGTNGGTTQHLDGDSLIPIFLNQGRVLEALEKATVLGTDLIPIFVNLTESCCRMTAEGPAADQGGTFFDQDWVNGDPLGSDWEGCQTSKAWRLLQIHLENKFPLVLGAQSSTNNHPSGSYSETEINLKAWRCREVILETILKFNRSIKLPIWLLNQFLEFNPIQLLKFFFRFDLISDAFTAALYIIDQLKQTNEKHKRSNRKQAEDQLANRNIYKNISITEFDRLLNLTPEDLKKKNVNFQRPIHSSSRIEQTHLEEVDVRVEDDLEGGYPKMDSNRLVHLQETLRLRVDSLFDFDMKASSNANHGKSFDQLSSHYHATSPGLNHELIGR